MKTNFGKGQTTPARSLLRRRPLDGQSAYHSSTNVCSLIDELIFRFGRAGCCLDIKLYYHIIADQVIGHSRIIDIEIATANGEIGLHGHGVISDLDFGWEGDALG